MTASLAQRLRSAPEIADPQLARQRMADLRKKLDDIEAPAVTAALSTGAGAADLLAGIAAGSPYLWDLCLADPKRIDRFLASPPEKVLADALARAGAECAAAQAMPDAMRALRLLKQEAALLIALADLGGVWDVTAVTRALTEVADAALVSALRWLMRQAADAGRMTLSGPLEPEKDTGFVVLAMGKHGAGELNYSSDIDIIVLYDPETNVLSDSVAPASFFVKLTQGLVRMLSERTADGYVFRVDLRLRPDPGATAIAISVPAAFSYYESVGQNWERAAMIKARPCAGDIAAGEAFLAELAPFIWRKHLDYAAIADVHAMKRQINVHKGHGTIAVAGHDLKLGRGGIREIEFFVQTQQLIAGGRNPALRGRETLAMLQALAETSWITLPARDELTEAYVFLRGLEHRLQMVADEQTHTLPASPAVLEAFARFAGYEGTDAFSAALLKRLETVQDHYVRLFETSPSLSTCAGSLVFTGKDDDPETMETLARFGFSSPPSVAQTIRGWHFGRYPAMRSARAREDLTELTPALLEALAKEGRPDEALRAFDALLARMPSGFQLLSILRNNSELLDVLALILGNAPRLADVLAARPHALDGLLDPQIAANAAGEALVAERLRAALAQARSYEEVLDRARIFGREQNFLIGARIISGALPIGAAGAGFSAIAQATVEVLLGAVRRELDAAHGSPPGATLAVIAMGKLGGREMTATSDLDLIVVYRHDEGGTETGGPRPLPSAMWFARLTQRLIAALSVQTAEGALYAVDMRLRPSGRQGPVAVHIDAFLDYQRQEAWTWEQMALSRARVIAGTADFRDEVGAAITALLAAPREPAKVRHDVAEMRKLLAKEKPAKSHWDLKMATGGMVDIEFVGQMLQLIKAADRPGVLDQNTCRALERLRDIGGLAAADHDILAPAFKLYTDLSQVVRLCLGGDLDLETAPEGVKSMLASCTGLPDFKTLDAALKATQADVRRVFLRLVA